MIAAALDSPDFPLQPRRQAEGRSAAPCDHRPRWPYQLNEIVNSRRAAADDRFRNLRQSRSGILTTATWVAHARLEHAAGGTNRGKQRASEGSGARRAARAQREFRSHPCTLLQSRRGMCRRRVVLFPRRSAIATRREVAAKCKDVSEILAELEPRAVRHSLRLRVAFHDSCHLLHAQGVRAQPRSLLSKIPDLDLAEIPESVICCGSAGIYNLVQPDTQRGR